MFVLITKTVTRENGTKFVKVLPKGPMVSRLAGI